MGGVHCGVLHVPPVGNQNGEGPGRAWHVRSDRTNTTRKGPEMTGVTHTPGVSWRSTCGGMVDPQVEQMGPKVWERSLKVAERSIEHHRKTYRWVPLMILDAQVGSNHYP